MRVCSSSLIPRFSEAHNFDKPNDLNALSLMNKVYQNMIL